MAEGTTPKMSAKVFLGRCEFENEMKQVPAAADSLLAEALGICHACRCSYVCVCVCVCTHACLYVCLFVCMHACMHAFVDA